MRRRTAVGALRPPGRQRPRRRLFSPCAERHGVANGIARERAGGIGHDGPRQQHDRQHRDRQHHGGEQRWCERAGRAASSIVVGSAISIGQRQDIRAVLRIRKEAFYAFSSLADRNPSPPPISEFAQEQPAIRILMAINHCSAAAISHGVTASSGRPHSIGDTRRMFYRDIALMWALLGPSEASTAGAGEAVVPPAASEGE